MRNPPAGLRRLIRLYPGRHRREYGDEIWEVVCHRWHRAGGGAAATVAAFWDLAAGAARMWMDQTGGWTMGMGRGWVLDARFVARSLWKSRGFVATAVTVLACAVAANATVYSYVRGTLLAEAPYPDPESVVVIWGSNLENGQLRDVISGPNFIDLQREMNSVEAIAAFHYDGTYLEVDGHPEVMTAVEVSADFFGIVRARAAMGRLFDDSDRNSGAERSVVITHGFWRDWLGSDPNVVGSTLPLEGEPRTVLGVLPEDFAFIAPAPVFLPLRDDILAADDRGRIHYHLLARAAEGASVADVQRELADAATRMVNAYPDYRGWSYRAERLHEVAVSSVRPVILILVGTVLLVLLVALTNLATLFRVRASARAAEIGVRAALGAGKLRLARVLALETVALAAVGAIVGLGATPWILDKVAAMVPLWITIPDSAARVPVVRAVLDPGVVLVAFLATVAGALLITLPSVTSLIRGGARRRGPGRRVHAGMAGTRLLVGIELAVTTLLCVGAGLLVRSFDHLLATEVGVESEGVLTAQFADVWGLEATERAQYFRQVVAAIEEVPGVQSAGVIDYVDFLAEDDYARVFFLDRSMQPRSSLREEWRRTDRGLFVTAGMTILRGRGFEDADMYGTPRIAIVNQAFAEKHYPEGRAIGEMISTHNEAYRELTIVGVVADVRSLGPTSPPPPMLYVPNQGDARGTQGLYVRTEGDPIDYASGVRDAIWSVDPSQPVMDFQPLQSLVDSWIAIPRAARSLVLSLAGLAWFLSVVGVFGVASYAVRTRRAELGIRMALGASPSRLEADQMGAISPVIALGVGAGLIAAIFAARGARALLFGVEPLDPLSLGAAVLATSLAALLATYLPARRAGRVDPTQVLRPE